jgi:hypothetical protein
MALTGYVCYSLRPRVNPDEKPSQRLRGGVLARLLFASHTPNTLNLRYNPRSPLRSEARLRGLNCPTRVNVVSSRGYFFVDWVLCLVVIIRPDE